MPAATAAPAPPLEPPADRFRSHGLRVSPKCLFSVVAACANSGKFVRPKILKPAPKKTLRQIAVEIRNVAFAELAAALLGAAFLGSTDIFEKQRHAGERTHEVCILAQALCAIFINLDDCVEPCI